MKASGMMPLRAAVITLHDADAQDLEKTLESNLTARTMGSRSRELMPF